MYPCAFGLANLFELFSCALDLWDHNGDVPVIVGWLWDGTIVVSTTVVVCLGGVFSVIGILDEVVVFEHALGLV